MIKTVIFDLGGVLLDMSPLMERIYELYRPLKKERVWKQINEEILPLCRKEISDREFWENVSKGVGKKVPVGKLLKLWIDDYGKLTKVDGQVKRLVLLLRKKYSVALISNTTDSHSMVNRKEGIYGLFGNVSLSNELKMTKDSRDIFLLAAKSLSVKPEECVFIDDVPRYVEVAESAGMHSILFKNAEELEADLRSINVI